MTFHPARSVMATALLWSGIGMAGTVNAGSALTTPAGLSPGDTFRFVFVHRWDHGCDIVEHRGLQRLCECPGGRRHLQRRDRIVGCDRLDCYNQRY